MTACAVVIGGAGGLGSALVAALLADPATARVVSLSREAAIARDPASRLWRGPIDITDEASIAQAAAALPAPPHLVLVATGLLHGSGLQPEKSYRALSGEALLRSFQVNTIGPALVAKHMLPHMAAPGRSVFAVLSARIGSIGDNRSGGWHSYRASKAALNMILRNLAIELARQNPELLCVGLHPGTVATRLSEPYQRHVAPERLFSPALAAERLLAVIAGLQPEQSGCVLDWAGQLVPP